MSYTFTSEIVFRGHPDKVCDQIADALLDFYLEHDPYTRAGIEVMAGKGLIVVSGEITSSFHPNNDERGEVIYNTLHKIGYGNIANRIDTTIYYNIAEQSREIAAGVNRDGAGDQGIMYGFACDDTPQGIPVAQAILQQIAEDYDTLVETMGVYYHPDGKAQLTGIYDDEGHLQSITNVTIAFCHRPPFDHHERLMLYGNVYNIATDACAAYGYEIDPDYQVTINTAGDWTIGGMTADTGLTGRKIVCDAYGGFAPVGGGAFSGKDPTKMDRSAAYKARQIAMRILKVNRKAHRVLVQLAYQIGVKYPASASVKINDEPWETLPEEYYMECYPAEIIKELDLRRPIYENTAKYGHFGHDFDWEIF